MGIDSLWPRILKAEGDEYVEKKPLKDVHTVFVDRQVATRVFCFWCFAWLRVHAAFADRLDTPRTGHAHEVDGPAARHDVAAVCGLQLHGQAHEPARRVQERDLEL